jgi:hypothetical protein
MTKSALAVAREALAAAGAALPAYSSPYSKRTYTQHQLFALLALREFLKTDYRGLEQHLRDGSDLRAALGLATIPDHSTEQKAAARLLENKTAEALLDAAVAAARARGRTPPKPRAAVDATGLETRHASRYFVWGAGRRHHRRRRWPKLTAVLDTATHLFLAAHGGRGPTQDSPQFKPAVRAACRRLPLDTLLGDAGYDAEHNHALGRDRLGIRSTVIGLNRRGGRRKWPKTKYRRQMVRRFRERPRGRRHKRVYGQRWQIETGFSRYKRLLGSALRARVWASQKREIVLRVVTQNLMLLAA